MLAKLPVSPICPLKSSFLYTLKWLTIYIAFWTRFKPSEVHKVSFQSEHTTKLLGTSSLALQVPGQPEVVQELPTQSPMPFHQE